MENMKKALLGLYRYVMTKDYEKEKLLEFVRAHGGSGAKILDIGCGYGRNLKHLSGAGFSVIGVEKNPLILEVNRREGFHCMAPEELRKGTCDFDVLIFSHIVEHFAPGDLMNFLDHYLDFVKDGGIVIVATPLLTKYFYDDFDHVKVYTPQSLLMLWGKKNAQIQLSPRACSLAIRDLWFRRSPLRLDYFGEKYLKSGWITHLSYRAAEFSLALLFLASFRWVGKKDAWVGVFEKHSSGARI